MADIKRSLLNSDTWTRIGYMALFLILLIFARSLMTLLILVQTVIVLVSSRDNQKLREFGQTLSHWIFQTLLFVTFNSEQRSFPFTDWPVAASSDGYDAGLDEILDNGENRDDEKSVTSADDIPSFTASEKTPSAEVKSEDSDKKID